MKNHLPLPTLLSQALVAFTIEFDNEVEHRMPHSTGLLGRTPGALYAPWLTSMVMWFNCMRFVGDDGVRVRELERLARTGTNLNGMERWGYIRVAPDPADRRPKPPQSAWLIRAKAGGRMAREVWRPLFKVMEKRWEERFGEPEIRELGESLRAIVNQLDTELPDCLPILGWGLFSRGPKAKTEIGASARVSGSAARLGERLSPSGRPERRESTNEGSAVGPESRRLSARQAAKPQISTASRAGSLNARSTPGSDLPLPALLSRVLLAFAIEFESESEVSLAISANVLRLFGAAGDSNQQSVRIGDLPRLSGVSKEAIAMATGYLNKRGYAKIEKESPGSTVKVLVLTAAGQLACETYFRLLPAIEDRWQARFSAKEISRLRKSLEPLVGDGSAKNSPLFSGLEPYPDGWRASVRRPELLPHCPMALHRGGYPDGS